MGTTSTSDAGDAPRILLVDDDPTILKLLGVVLEREGLRCTTAESAEAALLSLDADLYRMLIVDKNLPGLDGMQLARIVHMLSPDLPILLITGYASPESAREAGAIGVAGYIRKPVDSDDFRRMVHDTLGRGAPAFSRAQLRFGSTFPPGTLPVVLARLSSRIGSRDDQDDAVDLDLLRDRALLLIEAGDDPRRQLVEILEVPECRVAAFARADEALEHIEREGFDLLIGAPEVLAGRAELFARSPRPPLGNIAIMPRDGLDEIIAAIGAGARGLIAPPFSASGVFSEISRVMRGLNDERLARISAG